MEITKEIVEQGLKEGKINEREYTILSVRLGFFSGEKRTLEEVGKHFNLTRERIRQIETLATGKLLLNLTPKVVTPSGRKTEEYKDPNNELE